MNHQSESLNKYIAGLLDTDGSMTVTWLAMSGGFRAYPVVALFTSNAVDPDGKALRALAAHYEVGRVFTQAPRTSPRKDSGGTWWKIQNKRDLNLFLPHVLKHMVVKAQYWEWLWGIRGALHSPTAVEAIKAEMKVRRRNSGPLKPKNYASPAWAAGVMDGDGCYSNRFDARTKHHQLRAECTLEDCDRIALDLLHKTFGGAIYTNGKNKQHLLKWYLNLGFSQSAKALDFLRRMVKHSRLKKHKIEMMIHKHQQRLNENTPKGEATV